jgi:hypothetical protein
MTREPVVLVNLVKAVLILLIAFGVHVDDSQQQAIIGLVGIIATFGIGTWITRQLVTPIGAPVLDTGTAVTTPDGGTAIVAKASPTMTSGVAKVSP